MEKSHPTLPMVLRHFTLVISTDSIHISSISMHDLKQARTAAANLFTQPIFYVVSTASAEDELIEFLGAGCSAVHPQGTIRISRADPQSHHPEPCAKHMLKQGKQAGPAYRGLMFIDSLRLPFRTMLVTLSPSHR